MSGSEDEDLPVAGLGPMGGGTTAAGVPAASPNSAAAASALLGMTAQGGQIHDAAAPVAAAGLPGLQPSELQGPDVPP